MIQLCGSLVLDIVGTLERFTTLHCDILVCCNTDARAHVTLRSIEYKHWLCSMFIQSTQFMCLFVCGLTGNCRMLSLLSQF